MGLCNRRSYGDFGNEFLKAYENNRESQNTEAINSDDVATLMVAFMSNRNEWSGTITQLLQSLENIAEENSVNVRGKAFPQKPNSLSRRLTACKSNLESVNIYFEITRKAEGSTIKIYKQ